jgi:hypothetical protein
MRGHSVIRRFSALIIGAVLIMCGIATGAAQSLSGFGRVTLNAEASPTAARIADLDGDNLNDIGVVDLQGSLQLFFNAGGGAFQRVSLNSLWPSGTQTLDLAIGDLNEDGKNDIAVANSGAVSVVFNLGNRTFSGLVNYSVCAGASSIAIGDLNRDGRNDIVVTGGCSKVAVLLNTGGGGFALSGLHGSGSGMRSLALTDYNRDGLLDIVFLNSVFNGLYNVLAQQPNGAFTLYSSILATNGGFPSDMAVGDFERDGASDVVVSDGHGSAILVFLNNNGTPWHYMELEEIEDPTGVTVGDFNADGLLDIAYGSFRFAQVKFLLNRGIMSFQPNYLFTEFINRPVGAFAHAVTAGRLDGDLATDLVTVNRDAGSISVLLSTRPEDLPPPQPVRISLSVSSRKSGSSRIVDVVWAGATTSTVDIFRNGSLLATVPNSGSYKETFSNSVKGNLTYKVCNSGGGPCSNEVTIKL